jgi:hypothetical protein
MPIACSSQQVLTGQEGAIYFQPAGTQFCLADFSDFPIGQQITIPGSNDFRVGDPIVFIEQGTASLDSALTAGTTYYIISKTALSISVASISGGLAITMKGDGGTGLADTAGSANHIKIDFAEFMTACQVKSFNLEITREELDTTTLPCGFSSGGNKYAQFRSTQSGYASGSGSLTLQFTQEQESIAQRIMGNTLLKSQSGAEVKFYVNHVADSTGLAVDDLASSYMQFPISITSMSVTVNPDDATTAELNFAMSGQPTAMFGAEM